MRHVMFVDDDPSVLSGIRRMLHPMRGQWRMSFANGGHEAVESLTADPAHVVVSDMRMPGMDGAELLSVVRSRWPGAVRIILSGFSEESAALRSVPVAHRFISKPCDPDKLLNTVRTACELQDRLSQPELRRLLGGLGGLPSPPGTYVAITEELGRPDVSVQAVAAIVEGDPACTAKLLQLVNSAFFGLARSMTDPREAVAYLGVNAIRGVVLAAEAADLFRSASPELARAASSVMAHSATVAAAVRERVPAQRAQEAFIAGLLHDIGWLALAQAAPEEFLAVREDIRRGKEITLAERERLGATHAEVGGYLLNLWGLPYPLVDPVTRHHDPEAVHDPDPVVAAVAAVAAALPAATDG